MASNEDLEKEILKLDAKAVVKDLKNAQLVALLKKLKDESDADEEETRKKGYYICKGRSLCGTGKGLLNEGSGPYEKSLFGDADNLARLVKAKVIEYQK